MWTWLGDVLQLGGPFGWGHGFVCVVIVLLFAFAWAACCYDAKLRRAERRRAERLLQNQRNIDRIARGLFEFDPETMETDGTMVWLKTAGEKGREKSE